jgi:hypothetical protein
LTLTVSKNLHPAESAHWYTREGLPAYEVMAKNGSMRATTLRDARIHGYLPSVTSIINCAAKPGLDRWKQEQVLLAALTLSRLPTESEEDYLVRVMDDSREQGKKAAERGTAIHASIEGFYGGEGMGEHPNHVRGLENALTGHLGAMEWIPEKAFACSFGYGGKLDLLGIGASQQIIVDVKTKEFTEKKLPEAYDDHLMQLAAYRAGVSSKARCINAFVSSIKPGLVHLHEWQEDELERGWKMFSGLLHYWYAKSKLDI